MQGVEAAQNNLTNSMEKFYSVLSANTLTDFYNGAAGIVDFLNAATEATGGLNLKIPATIAGLLGVVSVVAKVVSEIRKLKVILGAVDKAFNIGKLLSSNIGLIAGGAAAILTIIGSVIAGVQSIKEAQEERFADLKDQISINQSEISTWQSISDAIEDLGDYTAGTVEHTEAFNSVREQIAAASPGLQVAYGKECEGIKAVGDAAVIAAQNLKAAIDVQNLLNQEALPGFKKAYDSAYDNVHNGDRTFVSYKQSIANYDPDGWYDTADHLETYVNHLEMVFEEIESTDLSMVSIDKLRAYGEEIQNLINGEYLDIEDSLVLGSLGTWANKVNALLTIKENEFAEQKTNIEGILAGIVSGDEDLVSMKYNATDLFNSALSGFMNSDFVDMNSTQIEDVFNRYMEIAYKTVDGWNFEDQLAAQAMMGYFSDANIDTSFIQRYIDAYSEAFNAAFQSRSEIGRVFAEKVMGGEFTVEMLEAFKGMIEGMNAAQIEEVMSMMVEATSEELSVIVSEWQEASTNVEESAEDVASALTEIGDIVAPAKTAQKALKTLTEGGVLNADTIEDLIDKYPDLADELLDYAQNTKDATKLIKALSKAQEDSGVEKWADDLSSALKSLEGATEGTRE